MIPKDFFKAIVSVGQVIDGNFKQLASAFIVGKTFFNSSLKKNETRIFLVSNYHVFFGKNIINAIRFNDYVVSIKKEDYKWGLNKTADVAVCWLGRLINQDEKFLRYADEKIIVKVDYQKHFLTIKEMELSKIGEGSDVFVIGFPWEESYFLDKLVIKKNIPILRKGIISKIDEDFLNKHKSYLIDAAIWGGNSGGFVIANGKNGFSVIGMIKSVAQKKSIILKDTEIWNSIGLGLVVPVEYIKDCIDLLIKKL